MHNARISAEQIVKILREADQAPVNETARKHGVSDAAIYTWRKKFENLDPVAVARLRERELKGGRRRKSARGGV
jgi:putative transposase